MRLGQFRDPFAGVACSAFVPEFPPKLVRGSRYILGKSIHSEGTDPSHASANPVDSRGAGIQGVLPEERDPTPAFFREFPDEPGRMRIDFTIDGKRDCP